MASAMMHLQAQLEARGHVVIPPKNLADYAQNPKLVAEKWQDKLAEDLIRQHYEEIAAADAVLICNYEAKGIPGYIGGNAFLEAGFAHVLRKPLYFLYPIPNMPYRDELVAMQPEIIGPEAVIL